MRKADGVGCLPGRKYFPINWSSMWCRFFSFRWKQVKRVVGFCFLCVWLCQADEFSEVHLPPQGVSLAEHTGLGASVHVNSTLSLSPKLGAKIQRFTLVLGRYR